MIFQYKISLRISASHSPISAHLRRRNSATSHLSAYPTPPPPLPPPRTMPSRQRVLLCSHPRHLAFMRSPTAINAAPKTNTPAPPLATPSLSSLTPADRLMQVALATTSNLFNGAIFGALFGFVSGAWSSRSLRGAGAEARSNARSWAVISAVYAGLQTAAKVVRGKEDRYNAIIGACGSGAVFSAKAGPRAAAQGCVSFAALSYLIDTFASPSAPPTSDEAILRKAR